MMAVGCRRRRRRNVLGVRLLPGRHVQDPVAEEKRSYHATSTRFGERARIGVWEDKGGGIGIRDSGGRVVHGRGSSVIVLSARCFVGVTVTMLVRSGMWGAQCGGQTQGHVEGSACLDCLSWRNAPVEGSRR
jgi:hypothetical protein